MSVQATNQGLEAAVNTFASAALALAELPAADFSINNSYVLQIASTCSTDIYEGIDTIANHVLSQVTASNTRLMTIQVGCFPWSWQA